MLVRCPTEVGNAIPATTDGGGGGGGGGVRSEPRGAAYTGDILEKNRAIPMRINTMRVRAVYKVSVIIKCE